MSEVVYLWYGLNVRLEWAQPILEAPGRAYAGFHGLTVKAKEGAHINWNIRFSLSDASFSTPMHAKLLAEHETGIQILEDAELIYLRTGGSLVEIDCRSGIVTGTISASTPENNPQWQQDLYNLLTFSLLIVLQEHNYYAIHAAALCKGSDEGVVFIAASDSGKSTLTMSLVREGWHFLSDDSIVLFQSEAIIKAGPLRRDFALDPEAAEYFPEITAYRKDVFSGENKWLIDMASLYPGQHLSACIPRVLFFPEITNQPTTTIESIGQSASLIHIMAQSSFITSDTAGTQRQLDVLKSLIDQAHCYRLLAGLDLLQNPKLTSTIVEDVLLRH